MKRKSYRNKYFEIYDVMKQYAPQVKRGEGNNSKQAKIVDEFLKMVSESLLEGKIIDGRKAKIYLARVPIKTVNYIKDTITTDDIFEGKIVLKIDKASLGFDGKTIRVYPKVCVNSHLGVKVKQLSEDKKEKIIDLR